MEKFVDRIIETDRKAREIIEQAQQEKKTILADAKTRAEQELLQRQADAEKGKAEIDAEFETRTMQGIQQMDAAYLNAKHALDETFETGHDVWLCEITQNTLALQ